MKIKHSICDHYYEISKEDVVLATLDQIPGRGRRHFVLIRERWRPVKQVVRMALGGDPPTGFHTDDARRILDALDFELRSPSWLSPAFGRG